MQDMTPVEYNSTLRELVHAMRVNPFNELTRLTLADLLDEGGKNGVSERTSKWLRADPPMMPWSTVDFLVRDYLITIRGQVFLTDNAWSTEDCQFLTRLQAVVERFPLYEHDRSSLEDYGQLWELVAKHAAMFTWPWLRDLAEKVGSDREKVARLVTTTHLSQEGPAEEGDNASTTKP